MKRFMALMAVLLIMSPLVCAQVEYMKGEQRAEERFYQGKGGPWIGGERSFVVFFGENFPWNRPPANQPGLSEPLSLSLKSATEPATPEEGATKPGEIVLLGFVTIESGNLTVMDMGASMPLDMIRIPQGPGSYPVYGLVDPEVGMTGLCVDLRSEGSGSTNLSFSLPSSAFDPATS